MHPSDVSLSVEVYLPTEIREIPQFEDLLYRIGSHTPHGNIIGVLHLILQFDDRGRPFSVTGMMEISEYPVATIISPSDFSGCSHHSPFGHSLISNNR